MATRSEIPESSSEPALSAAEWGKLFAGRANDAKSTAYARAMTHGLDHWSTPSCHCADGEPGYVKQTQFRAGRELLGRAPAYGAEPGYVKQSQFDPATSGREIRNARFEIRNKSEIRMTQTSTPVREPMAPNNPNQRDLSATTRVPNRAKQSQFRRRRGPAGASPSLRQRKPACQTKPILAEEGSALIMDRRAGVSP